MNNMFDNSDNSMGINYDFSPSTYDEVVNGGTKICVTKTINVDDMGTYIEADAVPLSDYGLIPSDIQDFIDGKLNVLVVLNIIPAFISTIAPQVTKKMSKFTKKILGHLYQTRFETNESDCVVIEPLKTTMEELLALDPSIKDKNVLIMTLTGIAITLLAIKSSSIAWFDLPKLFITTPFSLSGSNQETNATNAVVVTDKNIIWLSFTSKNKVISDLGNSFLDAMCQNLDDKLNVPEGTSKNSTASETVAAFYESSQDEEYIATLPKEIQDKMRGCKEKIETMTKWNGYQKYIKENKEPNVFDFIKYASNFDYSKIKGGIFGSPDEK